MNTAPLRADIERRLFRRTGGPRLPDRVGIELELLPVFRDRSGRVPVSGPGGMREVLTGIAGTLNWTTGPTGIWLAPCGCRVTFEPGGQLEISTPTAPTVDRALDCLGAALGPLKGEAARSGVELLALGYDPETPLAETSLQLREERYREMDRHFLRFGSSGARMMRQSCALQINLDLGSEPLARWAAANRIAPLLTAIFANSSRSEGNESGWRSYRAAQWRSLDPSRTGVVGPGHDPIGEYLAFALQAERFLCPGIPFLDGGRVTPAWEAHLSTLFPEIRPRGYLEIRSVDALPFQWVAAPLVFAVGILYDADNTALVNGALPYPGTSALVSAARNGLGDAAILEACRWTFQAALQGARRLIPTRLGEDAWQRAADYYERFTSQGLDAGRFSEADLGDRVPAAG